MRLFLRLLLFCLSLSIFTDFASAESVKITTWNLNWLIPQENIKKYPLPENIPKRTPQDWGKLKYYAQKLSSDILLLEEVDGLAAASKIFPTSDYELYETEDNIPQREVLAIRKKRGISVQQNSDLKNLADNPDSPHPLRSGLDATLTFKNQKKIHLLGVHLKAGCWERTEKEKQHSCPLLYKQFKDLKNWISSREKEGENFILLGDFNRRLSTSDFIFKTLNKGNLSPLILTSAGLASPCEGGEYFIDHFILNKNDQIFPINNSLTVQTFDPKDVHYTLSDHCAVSLKLNL
ncbi:endonuclease/exonuclease/phosphatase family protein [Acetobacteraceae bacterium]|nr:endonuclease/exonuclease/phosphatase family protein [Acetobacteraceae bacterium]